MEEADTTASVGAALRKEVLLTKRAYVATRGRYGAHNWRLVQDYVDEKLGDPELEEDEPTKKRRKFFDLMDEI